MAEWDISTFFDENIQEDNLGQTLGKLTDLGHMFIMSVDDDPIIEVRWLA